MEKAMEHTGFLCSVCGANIYREKDSCSTGYATNDKREKICYSCCAEQDKQFMRDNGRITLYLVDYQKDGYYHRKTGHGIGHAKVTNWPASLMFENCFVKNGFHNIAGTRRDVWFQFEGTEWHGVQYGGSSDLCHCKRLKKSRN